MFEVLKALYQPFLVPEGCWQEGWGLSRAVQALRHCRDESPVTLYLVNKISAELGEERSKEYHDLNFPHLNKSKSSACGTYNFFWKEDGESEGGHVSVMSMLLENCHLCFG